MRPSRYLLVGALVAGLAASAACSTRSSSTTATTRDATGQLNIAYLPGPASVPYFATQAEAIKEAAASQDATVTVFDAGLDANKQVSQLQDIVASGKYDGAVIVPLSGAAIVPAVNAALESGMAIGAANVPIGTDPSSTESQVAGVAVYAGRPFTTTGQRLGTLTKQACADTNPCRVAFQFGLKASVYDQALHDGFMDEIKGETNVSVVAEAENQYSSAGGLTAMQNLIQAHPDLHVVVAVDQAAVGVELALSRANISNVKIIGFGGSQKAVDAVRTGRWFGDVVQVPKTEGTAALDGVIASLREKVTTGYVDPVAQSDGPADSIITEANASQFTAQYDG